MAKKLEQYDDVVLSPDNLVSPVDFCDIFGRCSPVHLEIGSGKGTFLLGEAKAMPEADFIGIEWASKYYRHAVDRIGRWQLKNVRLIRTDAAAFISDFVADNSIDCIHIYFPDPWPKKRHNKRRFISADNLHHILRTLKMGGIIKIATDHADYFQQIRSVMASESERIATIDFIPTAGAQTGEYVGTNFERKYITEKRNVYILAVRKIK